MWLAVREGGASTKLVELTDGELVIGRAAECDLQLHDDNVSRRHASLSVSPDGAVILRDLSSANGTFVNGQRAATVTLEGGEQLQLGDAILVVHRTRPAEDAATRIGGPAPPAAPVRESAIIRAVMQDSAFRRVLDRSSPRRLGLYGAGLVAVAIAAAVVATRLLGADAVSTADVVAEVAPSTALVEVMGATGAREATGTGWVLDAERGLIVTNAHVINQGATFKVALGGRSQPAAVHAVSPCDDLAILRLPGPARVPALPLGGQGDIRRGDRVVAVGYPGNASLGDDLTSTEGIVSVVRTAYRESAIDVPAYPNVIQTDAAINPGNSGGPLVDTGGRVVGVNSAVRTAAADGRTISGQSYAIGVDRAREVLPVLRDGRSIGWTGIGFGYPTTEVLQEQGLPAGLTVTLVVPGSPAAKARLGETGRILVAVNGNPVTNTLNSYCDAIRGADPAAPLRLGMVSPGSQKVREISVPSASANPT